jgi:hypothetical protein
MQHCTKSVGGACAEDYFSGSELDLVAASAVAGGFNCGLRLAWQASS